MSRRPRRPTEQAELGRAPPLRAQLWGSSWGWVQQQHGKALQTPRRVACGLPGLLGSPTPAAVALSGLRPCSQGRRGPCHLCRCRVPPHGRACRSAEGPRTVGLRTVGPHPRRRQGASRSPPNPGGAHAGALRSGGGPALGCAAQAQAPGGPAGAPRPVLGTRGGLLSSEGWSAAYEGRGGAPGSDGQNVGAMWEEAGASAWPG